MASEDSKLVDLLSQISHLHILHSLSLVLKFSNPELYETLKQLVAG